MSASISCPKSTVVIFQGRKVSTKSHVTTTVTEPSISTVDSVVHAAGSTRLKSSYPLGCPINKPIILHWCLAQLPHCNRRGKHKQRNGPQWEIPAAGIFEKKPAAATNTSRRTCRLSALLVASDVHRGCMKKESKVYKVCRQSLLSTKTSFD